MADLLTEVGSRPERGDTPASPPVADRRSRSRWIAALVLGAVVAAAGAVVLWSYPGRFDADPVFINPHENARYELSRQWFDTGRPVYDDPLYDVLPADVAPALLPRDAAMEGGTVYPKDFPYAFSFVALLLGMWRPLAFLLNPLSALAVLLLAAALARELFASRAAMVLAAALLASSAAFWSAAQGLIETGATPAAFVLGATFLLVRNSRAGSAPHALVDGLAGALLGVAIGLHYAVAIVGAVVAAALLLARRPQRLRSAMAVGAGTALALVPAALFNLWLYGSPTRTGYGIGAEFFQENARGTQSSLFGVKPNLLLDHVVQYILRPETVLLVGLAVVGWRISRRHPAGAPLSLALALAVGPYLLFVGGRPLWGHETFQVNASFLRYLLPVLALGAVLAAGALAHLLRRPGRTRLAAGAAVAAVLVLSVASVAAGPAGPRQVNRAVPREEAVRDAALAAIPPDALVITRGGDKYLWPARHTLVAAYLTPDAAQRRALGAHIYGSLPTFERLADIVDRLVAGGHEVFVWDATDWFAAGDTDVTERVQALDADLAGRGVERLQLDHSLWRFVPAPVG